MLEKIWPNELTKFILDLPEAVFKENLAYWDISLYGLDLDEDFWCTRDELEEFLRENLEHEDSYGWEGQWEEYWCVYKLSNWDYIRLNSQYQSWNGAEYQDIEQVYMQPHWKFAVWIPTQASADLFLSKAVCRIRDLWLEVKELSSYLTTSENQTT